MLGVRLDPRTERSLASLAKRENRSKSEIAREAIARHVLSRDEAYLAECRRQSLRAAELDDADDWTFWEAIEAEDGSWT